MEVRNYATKHAFSVYKEYLALKAHFNTSKYDYHRMGGRVSAKYESFVSRRDVFQFYKLSKMFSWKSILLANFVSNKNFWIGDVASEESVRVHREWCGRIESLSYTFSVDLSKLDLEYKNNFVVVGGQYPHLLSLIMQKEVSLETFTILSEMSNVLPYWREVVSDKYIARDWFDLAEKYAPFLDYDKKKFADIVKDRFFYHK